MIFRRTALALALPLLSLVVAGCNPPIDEANKGTGAPAPAGGDAGKTTPPTTEPAPADVKPKDVTPSPEAGAVAPAPTGPAGETPK